jgi:hypothetical protein
MVRAFRQPPIKSTVAPGFAANGMSRWSRSAASRGDWTPRTPRKRAQPRALILKTEDEVAALRKQLRTASESERDRLMKFLSIKMKFLDRLHSEIRSVP